MLGVLKRRWKPKRSSAGSRIPGGENAALDGYDRDKPQLRPHQVHPVLDSRQTIICYEKSPVAISDRPPSPQPQNSCYPLAPNICVEAGRIQFIRQEVEDAPVPVPPPPDHVTTAAPATQQSPNTGARITVTRGLQTDEQEGDSQTFREIQAFLENRIVEVESALETSQRNELRDKQTINKLTKQLNRRESAQRDADRERRLRADSETRAKQALQEAARCRSRLKLLTSEFQRMEDTVRAMLAYKKHAEQLRQEKAALTLAFENRCQQYQSTISRLNTEIATLRQQLEQAGRDNNPEGILQAHAAALHRQAEESRKQYERCLDDVANQVVRALLTQKGLREEVNCLNTKIHDLETQNQALASMLVHQLRSDSPETADLEALSKQCFLDQSRQCFFEDRKQRISSDSSVEGTSPMSLMPNSFNVKHCNSFNSEVLEESPTDNCDKDSTTNNDKRLSADTANIFDTRFSLEDKKRHQILTKLWTELKGTEVTPKRLLEALSAVDSALWVPPKRPVSLNLHLPILQSTKYRRSRPILAQSTSKSEEETTGNESPESGNRDEGYSTMSSDVQADVTRGSGDATLPRRGLEDLKEASDETDVSDNRLLVSDNKDPDILYIPLNLLNLNQRNSYPPSKDMLPFQHIMRSFSDSHLCIKITTAPTPCYSFSSPISSSPSIFLVDITEKSMNPLRRTRGTSTLWGNSNNLEICAEENKSPLSWSSGAEDRLECTAWDAEYIQHWLKLDETRSTLQQHHRDMLELEYDRAELEDWSLSLSNDDLREQWKKSDVTTPGQISVSTLPSIQENNALELEEDSNECLWNNSSYMMDKEGRELMTLLMDGPNGEKHWPYAISNGIPQQQISPDNSWSSGASDCCNSHEPETCSKRSSVASSDTGELPNIGTDFTRDFYRLVKFESTKSLASTSSRSLGGALSENGDNREATLQNVLTFIAEQQKYVHYREPTTRPCSVNETTKEFNVEAPLRHEDIDNSVTKSESKSSDNENYVTLKQLCEEYCLKEKEKEENVKDNKKVIEENLKHANEVCLVTPIDQESENCSNISVHPVDICSSEITTATDYQSSVLKDKEKSDSLISDLTKSSDTTFSDISTNNCESLTSSVSTPDTIVSKIPRRRRTVSKIPVSPAKVITVNNNKNKEKDTKIPKSKIPHKSNKPKQKKPIHVQQQNNSPQHIVTSEKLPQSASGVLSHIIEGPPHRAVSFHERATSKDVIDELNRMIKSGDETVANQDGSEGTNSKLDQACRPTGWIHVEKDIDLADPKARANLLDVMMASVSSDSSPTSSCGGSVASDSTEDPPDYGHLHKIHKYHRQKKANATRPELAVVRAGVPIYRPTIIGRSDFFVRYGTKEREAVASFDFLDELSATSCSIEDTPEEGIHEVKEDVERVIT
ncbi:uncharacterized protein LOC130892214 isoform X3 [Diorhabda carinulata]|uniref:uncharacterized protein LOC130892214 isoform X3 n=1 Tax=Diorhabda carinulata TaxID=1163345 RepID=UPI0025A04D51|nr:uncharacterized protein LOC130892214 isoform X3 [Diorhabda carinulata]